MGLLATRWEADFEGHRIVVSRNELTKGFALECDGHTVAEKSWSLVGVGTLEGTIEHEGRSLTVEAKLELSFVEPKCTLSIGGAAVPMRQVK
jgi:hypothetical protein